MTNFTINLTCPFCQSPLTIAKKTWFCDGSLNEKQTKHPFDVARQGYVNVLPVQSKKSKSPGDSQESILARKRFLQTGLYQPLQNSIATLVKEYLPQSDSVPVNWLDIGCGEGYYSQKISECWGSGQVVAIDISKPAVTELAKSAKQQQKLWSQINDINDVDNNGCTILPLVASASKLPLADNSVQGVSSIFSPILPDELARVIADKGILLIAKPDEGHLASVRTGLFDEVREHDSDKFLEQLEEVGFRLLHTERVATKFTLNREQLADLLTMTPYSYRAKREKREALLATAETSGLITEGRFLVYILER